MGRRGAHLCLVVALIALLSTEIVYANDTLQIKYDDFALLVGELKNGVDKLRILAEAFNQVREENPLNLKKMKFFYIQVSGIINSEVLKNDTSNRAASYKLQHELRRQLKGLAAKSLANDIRDKHFPDHTKINALKTQYDTLLLQDIFQIAIDEIYYYKDIDMLSAQLCHLHRGDPEDEDWYRIMLETELYLFRKFQDENDINDKYLFNVAYCFYRSKLTPLYLRTSRALKRRVEDTIKSLPQSLQNLFWNDKYCLVSKQYHEYIYTTISDGWNYGMYGRNMFTWFEKNYTDNAGHTKSFVLPENYTEPTELNVKFQLKGVQLGWYYMIDTELDNRVSAWRTGEPTATGIWEVQYVDEHLVFRQGDLTLCVTEEKYNSGRRLIFARSGYNRTTVASNCQWNARRC